MITGKVIKDTVTKKLSRRIASGQIALIMHKDLDRTAAQELAAKKVKAVINLKPFISGGYPHQGPLILLQAGIVLYRAKEKLWNLVFEGDEVKIKKGVLYKNSQPVGKCDLLSRSQVTEKIRQAKAGLKYNLNNFIDNSLKYAVQEKNVILNICPPV
ncbi:MAG: hypothetical protein ACOC2G_01820, partial [Bacillota bacterium]